MATKTATPALEQGSASLSPAAEAATPREQNLCSIFDEIGSMANSFVEMLNASRLQFEDWNAQADPLRCMAQTIGALANLGIKCSSTRHSQVVGNADAWLALNNFLLEGERGHPSP